MKKTILFAIVFVVLISATVSGVTISLWHAYRGDEAKAIKIVARAFNLSHRRVQVRLLMVPFGAFSSKLLNTIPLRTGPDVFIYAQDHVGGWVNSRIILPLNLFVTPSFKRKFYRNTIDAFKYKYKNTLWAVPGSFKNICLFYNKDLIRKVPRTMNGLLRVAKKFTNPNDGAFGRWGFVYEMGNFYFHTMWVQGFGGRIFKKRGNNYIPQLNSRAMEKSMHYVRKLQKSGACPKSPSGTLVTQLFNRGKAMFVISGQWFRGEIAKNINYGVSMIPIIDESRPRRHGVPFLGVEGYFMARYCKDQGAAFKVIKYFTSAAMGKYMGLIGKQTPANKLAYRKYRALNREPISRVFRKAAKIAVPMPNNPEMALTWGPGTDALNAVLGGANIKRTLRTKQNQLVRAIRKMKRNN